MNKMGSVKIRVDGAMGFRFFLLELTAKKSEGIINVCGNEPHESNSQVHAVAGCGALIVQSVERIPEPP
jgi:hypothetical protein